MQFRAARALAAGRLAVRSERDGPSHVIAVSGELDLATAYVVDDQLRTVEASDADRIVLDLTGLDFIDSSGVHLVLAADARSRADRNRLRLLRGPRHVHRVFEITGVTGRLPFAA